MGTMTRGELITEGLLLAGNDSLRTRAAMWLNTWLRKQYAAWPWPFLHTRAPNVPVPPGSAPLIIGAGQGGVSKAIKSIFDPLYLYSPDRKTRQTVRIRALTGGPIEWDEHANTAATYTGLPTSVKLRPSQAFPGALEFVLTPFPDDAYLLSFEYLLTPDDLPVGPPGDSTKPLYPSDETMVSVIEARALQYMNRGDANDKLSLVATMAVNDRLNFGSITGINGTLALDPGVFRR